MGCEQGIQDSGRESGRLRLRLSREGRIEG